jgi:hypothetical protein
MLESTKVLTSVASSNPKHLKILLTYRTCLIQSFNFALSLKLWSRTYTYALFVVTSNFSFIFSIMWSFCPLFFSLHYKEFCPLQPINQWLDVLNDYLIYCNHRILLQILSGKSCSHILMVIWLIDDNMVIQRITSFFHCKFPSIWHPWLMTKWDGCSKYHLKCY